MCRFLFGDTGHSEMYLNGAFGECLTSHLNKQLRTVSFILLKNCSFFFFFLKEQSQPRKEVLKITNAALQRDFQPMMFMLYQVILLIMK